VCLCRHLLLGFLSLISCGGGSHVTLFNDGVLEALGAGEADPRFDTFTDAENVGRTSGELVTSAINQVDDIEGPRVPFLGRDDTNTTFIGTASNHSAVPNVKLDEASHLASSDLEFDGIVNLGERVGVADSATVVCDDVRDGTGLTVAEGVAADGSLRASAERFDTAQFEFGLFRFLDAVKDEAALGVIEKTELLFSLGDCDNVHETGRVVHVGADFAIDLDQASFDNSHSLFASQGVLETVLQNEAHRQAISHFVRTGGRARSPNTTKLGEHPMLGCIQSFQMSFLSTSHVCSIK
jgi:hypothetical protein